jgi:ABC-type transport system involved in multi-copper enzyme maturation permease subunit
VEEYSEIVAIWRGELGRAIRSGWALALVVLFLFGEGLLLTVVGFITTSGGQMSGGGADPIAQKKSLLMLFTNNSEATIDAIAKLPLVLLVAFSATAFFVPLLIALMGFDQLAGEVGPKSMRYLIVRVRRTAIVLGKYLTQATVLSGILVLSVLAMVGKAKSVDADFPWAEALRWGTKLSIAMLVIGVTYAALTTLCSAVSSSGALALFVNMILLFVFWFISVIGNRVLLPGTTAVGLDSLKEASPLGYIRYLNPGEFEHHLLSPDPLEYATGLIAYVGFALMFLGLAKMALARRDL